MGIRENAEAIWDVLTPEQRSVINALNNHGGAAAAVHQQALADAIGMDKRRLQHILKDLNELYGLPIGANDAGVFVMETEAERGEVAGILRARAISTLTRAQAINRIDRSQFDGECEAVAQGRLFD